MKPWEETWTKYRAEGDTAYIVGDGIGLRLSETPNPLRVENPSQFDARATMVACAPEMARMLLAFEWAGSLTNSYEEVVSRACLSCGGLPEELPDTIPQDGTDGDVGHADNCAWLALMKRAGTR